MTTTTMERVQPRRRAPGVTEEDLGTWGEGEPLETALTAPTAEVAACTEEIARLGDRLRTPEMTAEERQRLRRPGRRAQAERALLNASNLARAPEIGAATGVQGRALLTLVDKRALLGRARGGGLLVQSDAADGKLMLGSLFRFLAGKVDEAVTARLGRPETGAQERETLLADTADIAARKAEMAGKASLTREEGADEMAALAAQVQAARDEVDFLTVRRDLDEGRETDPEQLAGATRHAERRRTTGRARVLQAAGPGRERRKKPRK